MKVGLFFGSFNPIHIGHLILCSYLIDNSDLEQIWFVVSPQNPLKNKTQLLSEYDRLELVNIAIGQDSRFRGLDVEFFLPRPSYTIDTMDFLKVKYPNYQFNLIMGTDTVETLPRWKNFDRLLRNYPIFAYPRPGYSKSFPLLEGEITILEDVPLMEISATHIRNTIKNKKSYQYLMPEKVCAHIEKWGFYLK